MQIYFFTIEQAAEPFAPDAQQARQLALEELSKLKYQNDGSILVRIVQWLEKLFLSLFVSDNGNVSLPQIITFVAISCALLALGYFALRNIVRWRKAKNIAAKNALHESIFLDDSRSAQALFAAAAAAANAGDLNTAVIEHFRAIVSVLDEAKIISLRPGMTAFEVAQIAAKKLGKAQLFHDCAAAFSNVFYGSATATAETQKLFAALAAHVQQFQREKRKSAK